MDIEKEIKMLKKELAQTEAAYRDKVIDIEFEAIAAGAKIIGKITAIQQTCDHKFGPWIGYGIEERTCKICGYSEIDNVR